MGYPLLEIAFRGYSHWSMAITGGICACLLWWLDGKFPKGKLLRECVCGAGMITLAEFVCGCVVNLWLQLSVWDYSHLPLDILGQICLPFFGLWFLLCLPVFSVFRWFRRAATLSQ
jgi:uncharacterized membrane protein